jgi:very-short-patch-repair endonuclease
MNTDKDAELDLRRDLLLDDKTIYLVRTLSRTKRKNYENYVINAIWQRLGRNDIQPVSQQYVKRDGSYALIDLYFPQLNIGIECDEGPHKNRKEEDIKRTLSMQETIMQYIGTPICIERVEVYNKTFDAIEAQIDEVVAKLTAEIAAREQQGTLEPWNIYKNPVEIAIENHKIDVVDKLEFQVIIDIIRSFNIKKKNGEDYKGLQKGGLKLNDEWCLWWPKLAVLKEGSYEAGAKVAGWINTLSDDWEVITEENEKPSKAENGLFDNKERRITFGQSKDVLGRNAYRFLGVYEYDAEKSTPSKRVWKRVAESVNLSPWLDK